MHNCESSSPKMTPTSTWALMCIICSLQIVAKSEPSQQSISLTSEPVSIDKLSSNQPFDLDRWHASDQNQHQKQPPKSAQQKQLLNKKQPLNWLQLIEQVLDEQEANREAMKVTTNTKPAVGSMMKTCPPSRPFLCPRRDDPQGGDGECIPTEYLCDGIIDCPTSKAALLGYDEDPLFCRLMLQQQRQQQQRRPPVEQRANFLQDLLVSSSMGPTISDTDLWINYLLGPGAQYDTYLGGKETKRRLIKRSGISDQRLAEIQMIRALKKQFERDSKLVASNVNSAIQEPATS